MLSVQVTFSNGEKFEVAGLVIAHPRATYYTNADHGILTTKNHAEWTEHHTKELDYALNNGEELLTWIQNNMNWADVKQYAKKLPMQDHNVDFEKEFLDAKFEVLEIAKS